MSALSIDDLSILLVEPSPIQAKCISAELKNNGIKQLESCESIRQALKRLENYQPDLVISSMYFEQGTGTDFVRLLRANPKLEALPFMLISSEQRWEYLDPIKQAGVIAILPKPFSTQDLNCALKSTVTYLDDDNEIELENFDIATLRILVVDDSKLARKHIRRVLESMGAQVISEAENGVAAIELLEEQGFDLVVSDYNMPEMDGQGLLDFIRKESAQPYLPVLMVTSEANEAKLGAIQQSGVSAMCDKPFDVQNVRHLLGNILSE